MRFSYFCCGWGNNVFFIENRGSEWNESLKETPMRVFTDECERFKTVECTLPTTISQCTKWMKLYRRCWCIQLHSLHHLAGTWSGHLLSFLEHDHSKHWKASGISFEICDPFVESWVLGTEHNISTRDYQTIQPVLEGQSLHQSRACKHQLHICSLLFVLISSLGWFYLCSMYHRELLEPRSRDSALLYLLQHASASKILTIHPDH